MATKSINKRLPHLALIVLLAATIANTPVLADSRWDTMIWDTDVWAAPDDADGDGLSLKEENVLGTDPLNPDTDGDTLSDGQETDIGTDPLSIDTDGDGIGDDVEYAQGRNPLLNEGRMLNGGVIPLLLGE